MKNIIFIAPPAAGKGTQAKLVSTEYNIPHISTGDLLREEMTKESEIGLSIKKDMESGNLVSDEVITTLLKNRITSSDCKNGFILDGYPRNLAQAKKYNELLNELNLDKGIVIFFDIDKEVALKRTLSRIICSNCGSSYNLLVEDLKPQKENICDRCNSELKTRTDDTEEVFIHRFDTYLNSTKDLIEYYENLGLLHKVDVSTKDAKTIFEEVKEILND
ncbi:MAG: adenylate kinase [Bacilli bacterium]|nr:adenylate kinase [Bacilli bacterium]